MRTLITTTLPGTVMLAESAGGFEQNVATECVPDAILLSDYVGDTRLNSRIKEAIPE